MITNLRLQNFRSYKDERFDFGDGVNIIVGPNASGKTNLLEGILVICRGASFRASDNELIAHGETWARLDSQVNSRTHSTKLQIQNARVVKDYVFDGSTYKRFSSTISIPAVLFEPSHLQLLTESPDLRRNFLDDMIEQVTLGYASLRRNYKRALAQRNSLLKQSFTPDQLFIWNVRLSEFGGQIAEARQRFIETHQEMLEDVYGELSGKSTEAGMCYITKLNTKTYASSMLNALDTHLEIDRERGFTTIGPHRDDLGLELRGYALSEVASRGETRTMLLALKLLEAKAIEHALQVKPILLLDDVFSELDAVRRAALTSFINDHQTFITTTDADILGKGLKGQKSSKVISMSETGKA